MVAVGKPPVPVKAAVCGLGVALSVIVTVAVRVPFAVGRNVTLMEQLAPAPTLVPHVLVSVKLVEFVPVIVMLVRLKVAVPVFVNLIVWAALLVFSAWLAKVRDAGDRLTAGAVPVPVKEAVCGLPVALSVTTTDAVRAPAAVGLNVTLIEQFPPVATLAPHVFVCEKSPLLVPVIAMLVRVKVADPVLDRVIL